ncbi:MAG TPA: LysM peptidoglycan-binding domain-containing protein [Clostridiales bacterium]|jgi:hypothetical protein|nr:LysM peptidoglycan-binding domain-containing protein [Clostridiales bacterium]
MDGTIRYTVRPYDTIWMLAQVFNTTVDSIMELNPGMNPRNLQIGQVITIRPGYQYYPSNIDAGYDGTEVGFLELYDLVRMLWQQHIIWTNLVILSIVHNLPERDLFVQRLLRNATDFANLFGFFYGEEVAQNIENLFTSHITLAADLVQAAMAGDEAAYSDVEQRWYDNAEQMAQYFGEINPDWSEEDWSAMLTEHLDLLRDYVVNMLAQNYEENINLFDDIEMQAMEMADMMSEGISMQFPG